MQHKSEEFTTVIGKPMPLFEVGYPHLITKQEPRYLVEQTETQPAVSDEDLEKINRFFSTNLTQQDIALLSAKHEEA